MLEQFEKTGKDALADLRQVGDLSALEQYRIKYLSRKGQVTQMLSQIGQFSPEQRPAAGQLANKVKNEVTGAFERLKKTLQQAEQQKTKESVLPRQHF